MMNSGEEVLHMLADDLLNLEALAEQESNDFNRQIVANVREDSPSETIDPSRSTSSASTTERFAKVEEQDTDLFIKDNMNKNTIYKTRSDIKIFEDWLCSVDETRELDNIAEHELDSLLARFFLAVRKRDGSEYEPDTISAIQNSIDRHLRDKKVQFSIKRDTVFSHSNRVLESKRKSLKAQGKGNKKFRADPLTSDEVAILHSKNLLGCDSPGNLLHTVWINNGIYFGLRGRQDHTNLLWGDIDLKKTSDGREYLEFNERCTKTRSGAKKGDYRKVSPKLFAVADNENCPVKVYKTYAAHRPKDFLEPEARFYLQPLQHPSGDVWFSRQPVGKTKLGQIMNVLAEKGNLTRRKVNHSTRKTFATTLIQAGRAATEVAHLAGWKNVQTVNEYAVPSVKQQEQTSDIISKVMVPNSDDTIPPQQLAAVEVFAPPSATENNENHDPTSSNSYNHQMCYSNKQNTNPYAFLCGATISGGNFNINIYSGKRKHCNNSQLDSSQE